MTPNSFIMVIRISSLLFPVLFLLCLLQPTNAILPTAAIDIIIQSDSTATTNNANIVQTLLASQGNFAPMASMSTPRNNQNSINGGINDNDNNNDNQQMTPMLPPESDPLLCGDLSSYDTDTTKLYSKANESSKPIVFVVPRGTCSFQHKATVAQQIYGVSGVIIYGTLSSRYGYNETTNDIVYPAEYYDYDCSLKKGGGKVFIPKSKLIGFDSSNTATATATDTGPYNSQNDNLLSGSKDEGNLCAIYSENDDFENDCPSQRCLLTGNQTTISPNNLAVTTMDACCAWDKHIFLYKDDSMADAETGHVKIPTVIPVFYITMDEAETLFQYMNSASFQGIIMYSRWYPKYNISAVLVWAVGVFVAALASYLSASEIRYARKELEKRVGEQGNGSADSDGQQDQNNDGTVSMRGYQQLSIDREGREHRNAIPPEETLELTPAHAISFLVFSSAGLLTLFFFKIYNVVKVFYAFGCSGAIMQLIVYPMYYNIAKRFEFRDRVVLSTQSADIGTVTMIDTLSIITSYGLGAFWLYLAFTVRHPDTIPFFWIMQNIMGACMCILFLQTMKLNSIKVASILLIAAFFYDIFFVFVTPYLTKGGKSIMVDVATSGGPPKADPSWCEKYPDGPECQGGDPLPMLFTIPRIGDYAGGSSLLGLGDIVLPGLLLSFAARYDEAKQLIGASHSPRSPREPESSCCGKRNGYFVPAVIAYAIGLAMANVAVYVMRMGQPALLYLVPCCLGIIVYLGWKRGELSDFWHTPKVLTSCDEMLYGSYNNQESDVTNGTPDSNTQSSSSQNDAVEIS